MNFLTFSVLCQFFAVLAVGWLIGESLDKEPQAIVLSALVFVFWLVWQHRRFERWLSTADGTTRMGYGGFWTHISDLVSKRIRYMSSEQRQLQADIDFFRDSFQALHSAVVIIDADGRIGWCNQRAESLLGIIPERDRQQLLMSLIRAPEFIRYLEDKNFEKPLLIPSPVNPEISLEIQITTFRTDDVLIFARDVSDVVQLERMRQDFIANVSHEMRTPLTVITGYLDTLKMGADALPPIWQNTLDKMLGQSQRMDNMVNDLIWLSRLESIPASRDLAEVNLNQMLATIVADARVAAPKKIIELLIESGSEVDNGTTEQFVLDGIYEELRSAFTNLVQNAVKYTADDGEITVRCAMSGSELKVSVKDNGVGIDTVHIPRLTERFYRADASRTSATGGTGLGLAIVKHIMVRHDGRLEINSKLGKGSVFSCVFPADRLAKVAIASGNNAVING